MVDSFWGVRPLNPDIVALCYADQAAKDSKKKKKVKSRKEAIDDLPVFDDAKKSNITDTMFNTNIPLNQQLCAPVDLHEGGQAETLGDLESARGGQLATERGLVTQNTVVDTVDD